MLRRGHTEAARELGSRQPARELEQRQRVAARLGDDPLDHPLIDAAGGRQAQQRARVLVIQARHNELGQPGKRLLFSGLAHREYQGDRLCHEPPRNERERQRGRLIEPLRIVDDAHERLSLGNLSQQPEDRQTHLEPIRCGPRANSERTPRRLAAEREEVERAEHRPKQLLQPSERELHVSLHARRPGHHASGRLLDQLLEQRCLPDPRLAADDQDPAPSRPDIGQEPGESHLLTVPTAQSPRLVFGRRPNLATLNVRSTCQCLNHGFETSRYRRARPQGIISR